MQFDVRVRLLPDDMAPSGDGAGSYGTPTVRPFAEGIVQALTVRGADGDRELAADDELVVDDTLWRSAWALTRMLERPQEINTIDASGTKLVHLFTDTYGATFVPFLRDVLDGDLRIGAKGALVSMPLAHSVLIHPIDDSSVVQAAQAMIPITRQVHKAGPNSLSPHVYWWRDGDLTWVPTYFGRDGIEFHAPNGLADLIAQQD